MSDAHYQVPPTPDLESEHLDQVCVGYTIGKGKEFEFIHWLVLFCSPRSFHAMKTGVLEWCGKP